MIGHPNFLYVIDSKGAAIATRGTIDKEDGRYLVPLPMTGKTPDKLQEWVEHPPSPPQPIYLPADKDPVGSGFIVERQLQETLPTGTVHDWDERWLVTRSDAHAHRQQQSLEHRLGQAEAKLKRMRAKKEENAAQFQARAQRLSHRYHVQKCFALSVTERIVIRKKYLKRGCPTPDAPYELVTTRYLHLHVQRETAAIELALLLTGWRIHVTNVAASEMSLSQAIRYYRDQWLVERGFHRWKKGDVSALPLYLHLPERIKGLMLLLFLALQALSLLEFVACRQLAKEGTSLPGLVPGNPKMASSCPTAARMLDQFGHLHLRVESREYIYYSDVQFKDQFGHLHLRVESAGSLIQGSMIERLTPLQVCILHLLDVPASIYDIQFTRLVYETNEIERFVADSNCSVSSSLPCCIFEDLYYY